MSKPNVVEICICETPTPLFDDESGQYFDSDCGGLLKDRSNPFATKEFGERVIVNMAMLKITDKLLELAELQKHQTGLISDLSQLMMDWAAVLTPPEE